MKDPATSLPDGIEPTPLDAAILVYSLREIWRLAHRRQLATVSDEVRTLCRELELLIEQQIEEVGGTREAWRALKRDLVSEFLDRQIAEQERAS